MGRKGGGGASDSSEVAGEIAGDNPSFSTQAPTRPPASSHAPLVGLVQNDDRVPYLGKEGEGGASTRAHSSLTCKQKDGHVRYDDHKRTTTENLSSSGSVIASLNNDGSSFGFSPHHQNWARK